MAMAVLMLQALAVERGAAGRCAEEKAFGFVVRRGPDQIADPLKAKHRIVKIKGNHIDSQVCVSRTGGDERRHGAGLSYALLEDLSVFSFVVIEQGLAIDRFVELAL